MKTLAAVVLVLVAATLAAGVESARACSCALPDPRSTLAQTDGAVVGRLVSRREVDQQAVLTFGVERALKGSIGSTIEVRTASNSAACGLELWCRCVLAAGGSRSSLTPDRTRPSPFARPELFAFSGVNA
jgi:hypothetical protein